MNEFSLINTYFNRPIHNRSDLVFGVGDDAACVQIPAQHQLVISTDTLIADVHFLSSWDAYDIAYKAVMVNVSDMAAMAAQPRWLTLSLTLPTAQSTWLDRFSQGLYDALGQYNVLLIGGDTTRGSLSMTLTIHGWVKPGKAVRRNGAQPGDCIMLSGEIGAAALAVSLLDKIDVIEQHDNAILLDKLKHPRPRIDLAKLLQKYASAAIDISDGLAADLNHICEQSKVGAQLNAIAIPIHPLVKKYHEGQALKTALHGGDDYEICFTVPCDQIDGLMQSLSAQGLTCYPIGTIQAEPGLWLKDEHDIVTPLKPRGYDHFPGVIDNE